MDGHPFQHSPRSVVMAGDWHGDLEHARSVIGWAQRQGAEGIVQLGDFGVWPGASGKRYLDGVSAALRASGLWLCFIDGNHEDFDQLLALPLDEFGARPVRDSLWHLPRGLRWTWHDRIWLALGGATSVDRPARRAGIDWWPQEVITMGQALDAMDGPNAGRANVMVCHDAPAGYDVPGLPQPSTWWEMEPAQAHRRLLRSVVNVVRPTELWHGHFHVRYDRGLLVGEQGEWTVAVHGLNDNQGPWHQNAVHLDMT